MTITAKDIAYLFEAIAPAELAESYDNVGLLVGRQDKEIRKAVVCLDIDSVAVNTAVASHADIIISHHPFIFGPLKKVISDDWKGRLVFKLIRNDICAFSVHTNLDAANKGLNWYLAQTLGLTEICDSTAGMGKTGILPAPAKLRDFALDVKRRLNCEFVKVAGNLEAEIKKAYVFSGSFDGNCSGMVENNAHVLVTGDIKHNQFVEIKEMGLNAISAGHYATEAICADFFKMKINKHFSAVKVIKVSNNRPFEII